MDESLARLLMVIYAVLIPSASGLVAYWMTLRERRRVAAAQTSEFEQLRRAIEDLQERVDFTERALTQGRAPVAIEPKAKTPV
jgi:hypothetical protein